MISSGQVPDGFEPVDQGSLATQEEDYGDPVAMWRGGVVEVVGKPPIDIEPYLTGETVVPMGNGVWATFADDSEDNHPASGAT